MKTGNPPVSNPSPRKHSCDLTTTSVPSFTPIFSCCVLPCVMSQREFFLFKDFCFLFFCKGGQDVDYSPRYCEVLRLHGVCCYWSASPHSLHLSLGYTQESTIDPNIVRQPWGFSYKLVSLNNSCLSFLCLAWEFSPFLSLSLSPCFSHLQTDRQTDI